MNDIIVADETSRTSRFVIKLYASTLVVCFALLPAYLIAYIFFFQDPSLKFEDHIFHIIAIAVATMEGLFVTYVTWRCYRSSGEPLLRWMTLGFLGFALIYALHGAFTGLAHHNIWLFLLYGPASRLTMAILLFVALLSYHHPSEAVERRVLPQPWVIWVSLFVLVDFAVAYVANSSIAGNPLLRLTMEGGALIFSTFNAAVILRRQARSPLMTIFAISATSFTLSSLAFILGRPWNHMWWLAHAIFAAGFFLLSYGVARAFLTTRSFSTIYSQEEMMARLAEAMARTENALHELERTNRTLERLSATDPLTGADNRRRFTEQIEAEMARIRRGGEPFSVLALDLDNFKLINDQYGHQAGDDILKEFVQRCLDSIRPYDGVARVGGEEFMILLPKTVLEAARDIAERLRTAIASKFFESGQQRQIPVTISIGVSQFGRDGDTIDAIVRTADERLYDAKHQGRNRVVAAIKIGNKPILS